MQAHPASAVHLGQVVVSRSAWRVTDYELTPAGLLYTVVLGEREWKVIHAHSGWQAWNGHARCEISGSVRAAVLDYERVHHVELPESKRRWSTTMEDIEDYAIRTGFEA